MSVSEICACLIASHGFKVTQQKHFQLTMVNHDDNDDDNNDDYNNDVAILRYCTVNMQQTVSVFTLPLVARFNISRGDPFIISSINHFYNSERQVQLLLALQIYTCYLYLLIWFQFLL